MQSTGSHQRRPASTSRSERARGPLSALCRGSGFTLFLLLVSCHLLLSFSDGARDASLRTDAPTDGSASDLPSTDQFATPDMPDLEQCYVAAGGEDDSDCRTHSPCATVTYALTQCSCGSAINVEGSGSPYEESVMVDANCLSQLPLILRSRPGSGQATLRVSDQDVVVEISGSNVQLRHLTLSGASFGLRITGREVTVSNCLLTDSFTGLTIETSSADEVSIIENEITNNTNWGITDAHLDGALRVQGNSIHDNGSSALRFTSPNAQLEVYANTIFANGGTGIVVVSADATVERNHIYNNGEAGIALNGTAVRARVFNNLIHDHTSNVNDWGITAEGGGHLIENNTLHNNRALAIWLVNSAADVIIRNNIIANSPGIFGYAGTAIPRLEYNLFFNLSYGHACAIDGVPIPACEQDNVSHTIFVDPLFEDLIDFHLQPLSPAIDAGYGSPLSEPAPNGGRRNLGAWGGTELATKTP